jgi:glycerol uptake facilitator-like aquaporin
VVPPDRPRVGRWSRRAIAGRDGWPPTDRKVPNRIRRTGRLVTTDVIRRPKSSSDLRKRESHRCHRFVLNRIFSRPPAAWRLLAEAVGTFFLVSAAAGGEVVAVASKGQLGTAAKVAAPGIVVMAFIYALGDVSGAHFNPVVTLAFAVRGVFRWSCVPAYWIVQLAAAAVAALGLRALFGGVAHLGAPKPHVTEMKAVSVDAVLTLLLVLVILNTATRARVVGPNAAIAVGATIALCGFIGEPISGAR